MSSAEELENSERQIKRKHPAKIRATNILVFIHADPQTCFQSTYINTYLCMCLLDGPVLMTIQQSR